jgi:hypothetical protein
MTFAEYVNEKHPNAPLTPWQITMIHTISRGEKSIFHYGRSQGKQTVIRLWAEYCKDLDADKKDPV